MDPDIPLFGFIGRLEEQKGVDILLEALPAILDGAQPVQLVILGTGKKVCPPLDRRLEVLVSLTLLGCAACRPWHRVEYGLMEADIEGSELYILKLNHEAGFCSGKSGYAMNG